MKARIDTKNWNGNYKSNIVEFNDENHLSNYVKKINKSSTTKLIGIEIIDH